MQDKLLKGPLASKKPFTIDLVINSLIYSKSHGSALVDSNLLAKSSILQWNILILN